jgi:hypothetical protein
MNNKMELEYVLTDGMNKQIARNIISLKSIDELNPLIINETLTNKEIDETDKISIIDNLINNVYKLYEINDTLFLIKIAYYKDKPQ